MRKIGCLCSLFILSLVTGFAADAPAVTAREAAEIADHYLRERGLLDSVHIVSITLEKAAMLRPEEHWFVKWDEALPVDGMKKEEIGLKITQTGKVTRLVQ